MAIENSKIPTVCFAPTLTDEKLARYEELIAAEPAGETKGVLSDLLACVKTWWNLPVSQGTSKRTWRTLYKGKDTLYDEVPLEQKYVEALDSVTPWMRELNTLSTVNGDGPLDKLPNGELRDAAFHLLWHAKELTLDREPLTQDCLN
jgi:hypothetical protein